MKARSVTRGIRPRTRTFDCANHIVRVDDVTDTPPSPGRLSPAVMPPSTGPSVKLWTLPRMYECRRACSPVVHPGAGRKLTAPYGRTEPHALSRCASAPACTVNVRVTPRRTSAYQSPEHPRAHRPAPAAYCVSPPRSCSIGITYETDDSTTSPAGPYRRTRSGVVP